MLSCIITTTKGVLPNGKSKAKKKREPIQRQHSRNPELSRGHMPHFSTHERKTKTKQEALMKKHKGRNAYDCDQEDHKHFYFAFL
ncbi:hypothetical protein WAX46_09555 [Bacillus sp. FJAT-53060]|uniref:hypothetical protein n=1 Tax=Bacillus sp. FJAT-53060 TaxID=3127666 RepID=UPI0030140A6D